MLCSIILCAILTGLNFYRWYAPGVWIIFVSLIMLNVLVVALILLYRAINFCIKIAKKERADTGVAPDVQKLVSAVEESSRNLFAHEDLSSPLISNRHGPRDDDDESIVETDS
jgi:hypothetical protein